MNVGGKMKFNEKAGIDLTLYCKRKDLELKPQANRKMLNPKANSTLTAEEAKSVSPWLKELRMPVDFIPIWQDVLMSITDGCRR